jgi:hypothetical protein
MQRTGNDSFLKTEGVLNRQRIEQNNFEKILLLHYDRGSDVFIKFFSKMVSRLPRVVANLKSQGIGIETQYQLLRLYCSKYRDYTMFWVKVVPLFIVPNMIFKLARKIYFKYLI